MSVLRRKLGRDLVAVALFGSCARGDQEEGSDIDLLLLCRNLPERHFDRMVFLNTTVGNAGLPVPGFAPYTPEEFMDGFPSLYLDLGLDAVILYDPQGFLANRLSRIREIIEEAGLRRTGKRGDFAWHWKNPPKPGHWEITWEGFRETA